MMLLILSFGMLMQLSINNTYQNKQSIPALIMSKIVEEDCAVIKVFDFGNNTLHYEMAAAKRDDAAFYYIDEDKKEIIIHKKEDKDLYILKYIFVTGKKTYEIQLSTCVEKLVKNKNEMYDLRQKILNKEW